MSLRTTRIRTPDNSVVSIPNMRIASEPIANLSAREKFLYRPTLRVRSDTDPERLRRLLAEIRSILAAESRVYEDGARARLSRIGRQGLDLEVFAYINAADWADYLAVAETLNLRLLEILKEVNVELDQGLHAWPDPAP